jgi:hypothetical protein
MDGLSLSGTPPCRSTKKNSSENRSRNAASLSGRRSMLRTEYFGSKLLGVGRNSFARPKKLNDAGGNSRSVFYARTLKQGTKLERVRPREAASCTNQAAQGFGGWGGRLADSTVRPHSTSSISL